MTVLLSLIASPQKYLLFTGLQFFYNTVVNCLHVYVYVNLEPEGKLRKFCVDTLTRVESSYCKLICSIELSHVTSQVTERSVIQ